MSTPYSPILGHGTLFYMGDIVEIQYLDAMFTATASLEMFPSKNFSQL